MQWFTLAEEIVAFIGNVLLPILQNKPAAASAKTPIPPAA